MMRRFYLGFLRHAPMVLFCVFLIVLCMAFAAIISGAMQAMTLNSDGMVVDGMWMMVAGSILLSFLQAFEHAALILAAAAVIFRADKWLEAGE